MSDTKIPSRDILSREVFIKRLREATAPVGPSLNDLCDHDAALRAEIQRLAEENAAMDKVRVAHIAVEAHWLAIRFERDNLRTDLEAAKREARAEIQRLQTACDNKDVLHEMNVSIIGQRDAEIERLKPFEDLVQKAIQTIATLQAGYAEKVQECAQLERERDEAREALKEHEEEFWCFNPEHGKTLGQIADLRTRLEAASVFDIGGEITVCRCGQRDGSYLWAVRRFGFCLAKDGEWESEPIPSSRDKDFISRCRFESYETAISAAMSATQEGKE